MARKVDVNALRDEAATALERGKLDKAIELYSLLEAAQPAAPAWPKRIGEIYRRNNNDAGAIAAFERAAEKYALDGFVVQAIAVCKLILQIDPAHSATQVRLSGWMAKHASSSTRVIDVIDDPSQSTPRAGTEPSVETAEPTAPISLPRTPTKPGVRGPSADEPPRPNEPVRVATEPDAAARAAPPKGPSRSGLPRIATEPGTPAAPPAVRAMPAIPPRQRAVVRAPEPPPPPLQPPSEQRLPKPVPFRQAPMPDSIDDPPTSSPAVIISRVPKITLPPGQGLDSIDFSTLIPGTTPMLRPDGTLSGVNVLPLDPDLELSLDDAEPIADPTPGPAARRALLSTPLFSEVSPIVLEKLIAKMGLLELQPGAVLFREGETGQELYIVSEGEVAVQTAGKELARLGPGAFFGEVALVTDLPRSATIRALTRVELLSIDREVIREAAADHPEVVTVLLRFVRDRLIDRITHTSEMFAPFTEGERAALAQRFELVEVVPDAVLITQGERADGLYLIVAGRVEVWRDGAGGAILSTLGSGDVFGELSLLTNSGSTANVRSVSRVLALRMPASTFLEVIMTHPQVLAYIGELAERRQPRDEDVEFVDLHLDML